jgi:hypothetical protein
VFCFQYHDGLGIFSFSKVWTFRRVDKGKLSDARDRQIMPEMPVFWLGEGIGTHGARPARSRQGRSADRLHANPPTANEVIYYSTSVIYVKGKVTRPACLLVPAIGLSF